MKNSNTIPLRLIQRRRLHAVIEATGLAALVMVVAGSAIVTKEAQARARLTALTAVSSEPSDPGETQPAEASVNDAAVERRIVIDPVEPIEDPLAAPVATVAPQPPATIAAAPAEPEFPISTRWFNARPVRPAKTIWMTVTAYSPDERSCGDSADGITSSIHNVYTNAMKLVAADSRILPLGSMISVPGYDSGNVVPVLDRGGAIKGHRLDLLFPTHEAARKWGVKKIPITVWEYADGKPKDDFRKIRDSKN